MQETSDGLTCLDLFSGIGGFALGFHRAGIKTAAFCEIDPYARRVLAKNFPDTRIYDDIRSLSGDRLEADGIRLPGIVCGGFPCQDISLAGKGAGLSGERSGLWFEMLRVIDDIQPAWVVAENVAALRSRGLDQVLRTLAEVGYDAEWHCVPAASVGAPHRRDRVWIVAHANRIHGGARRQRGLDPDGSRQPLPERSLSNPNGEGLEIGNGGDIPPRTLTTVTRSDWWATEPDVGRVAHGVPSRVDRLRCLGNAVVPQIPEMIGRAIVNAHAGDQ
jgi:DNA (cytosine-5)-methyltransferase 1